MEIEQILLKKNLPHVVTAYGNGKFEELYEHGPVYPKHVILGMAELNKNGISLLNISVGNSKEGITKIDMSVLEHGSVTKTPTLVDDIFLPEGDSLVPFKSDTWALGEFLVRTAYHPEGKGIPKRFMKSQVLMDKFIDSLGPEAEFLKKMLVLDPNERVYTWDILKNDTVTKVEGNCTIQ